MAAHPYTMLKQMSESLTRDNPAEECRLIAHAMMYCQQADSIWEGLDIYDLSSNKFSTTLKSFIDSLLPKYESIWLFLGKPQTWEEWRERVLNLKTRSLGIYRKLYYQGKRFDKYQYMTDEEKNTFHCIHSDNL
jgi:hypothetical protein